MVIDFLSIIRYELHEQAFGDMMALPFTCLVQLFYDEASVPEVPGIDRRIKAMGVSQMTMIKDLVNLVLFYRSHVSLRVILAWFKGPSVSKKLSERQQGSVDTGMNFEMGEQKEALDMSTQK